MCNKRHRKKYFADASLPASWKLKLVGPRQGGRERGGERSFAEVSGLPLKVGHAPEVCIPPR